MAQRFSHQRERIYQTVLERRDHPTAEMVYQQLKPEMPRLSLGTVYRNLQQMAREGRLAEVDGPVTRFDAVTRPHTHFQCRFCGALMDLEAMPYDEALDRAAAAQGYQVTGHSLVFTGACPRCAAQEHPA
ncbi:transcriptional repressor [uncultured Oscillibacter sp.]|uniref:Fur family transcriptional regulator n=1 Tax=uncultured Oscillibacter sp. TaxID=876091 RepID=UPI001F9F69D1|nr:transcriptional repressor [uncultured Oscillibacter sp.]HJB32259.1 transcriptional repressor [Candidatus Oscillibacter excrementavium]